MKNLEFSLALMTMFFLSGSVCGQHNTISIVPEPASVIARQGHFNITKQLSIASSFTEAAPEVTCLQQLIRQKTGVELPVRTSGNAAITIRKSTKIKNPEGYSLVVNEKGITLEASSRKGIFYGIKTLEQLFPVSLEGKPYGQLPYVTVEDHPRFAYRALMLDPARHFLPVASVKKYIEVISGYKFNHLHLHLSDDQGWRMEVKQYPGLTEIGSKRRETDGNGRPHEGFYTQAQLKELVAYAKERHVELIPEIDMPGHGMSILAAYPGLACFPQPFEVRTTPGVSKELLCAGKESVYEFYEKVIEEVAAIFPNPRLHIGGDEAPLDRWKESPHCQEAIKKHGLKNEEELMAYFFERINKILHKYGKEPLLWYESNVESYPANSTVYLWRNEEPDIKLGEIRSRGLKMINAYGRNAYFDYPQWPGDGPHSGWMPVLSLEKAYAFDPVRGLPEEESDFIIGVEATIWGEYVPNIDRAFYMTFPRALALIEAGWSLPQNRSWEKFKEKLDKQLLLLTKKGVHFRPPIELSDKYDPGKY